MNKIINAIQSTEGTTIFKRWLDFAETDSPRLAKHSSWRYIDDNYRAVFSKRTKNIEKYTFLYLKIAQFYIDHFTKSNKTEDRTFDVEPINSSYAKYHVVNSFYDSDRISSIGLSKSTRLPGEKRYPTSGLKRMADYLYKRVIGSVEKEKISVIEISMSVYFLSLVVKFTIDKLDEK